MDIYLKTTVEELHFIGPVQALIKNLSYIGGLLPYVGLAFAIFFVRKKPGEILSERMSQELTIRKPPLPSCCVARLPSCAAPQEQRPRSDTLIEEHVLAEKRNGKKVQIEQVEKSIQKSIDLYSEKLGTGLKVECLWKAALKTKQKNGHFQDFGKVLCNEIAILETRHDELDVAEEEP